MRVPAINLICLLIFAVVIKDQRAVIAQCYGVKVAKNIVFFSLPRARARFVANIPIF